MTIRTETRPVPGQKSAASTPKTPGVSACQKSVVQPTAGLKPGAPALPRKRRNWPVLEAALILVLIKIAAGAFYIWNRPGESGREILASSGQSRPAPQASGLWGAVELPEAEDYLAAALQATQPAQARAAQAHAAPAPAVAGALSAGALLVVGAQSGAARVPENIPLPPGGEELLRPAAQMSQPASSAAPSVALPAAPPDFEALRNLRDREQELARREALLANQAGSLRALEIELDQRIKEAETVKRETESLLQRNEAVLAEQKALADQQKTEDEAQKDARLKHLVTAYTGMKPEQAGNLINSMDDDIAVAILSAMPGGKAGKILAMVIPDKAARLTKAISEKRLDPNLLAEEEEAI